ncbi:UDP-3-O-(3-hydroxymyristoyl)glucosamine N-acyltransferase [Selenomonas sputigena]|uniref:UDP-3-O-(3-hydroxymyristoyl)glucosamine N-acyltransferase n=1 Tax=Selenomonas sputigena TaxID=69823 RepID=UPI0028EDCB9B|nr:UDP-3-O-(3-hydroxymyristoyl)glucosamine N-acyltransferase [Selenomonas sputigena]
MTMKKTLGEIARFLEGRLAGDENIVVTGATNIEAAGRTEITFAAPPHIEEAKASEAAAVLLPEDVQDFPLPAIHVKEPRAAFAKLLELFTPPLQIPAGVSPQAFVAKTAEVEEGASILPFAVVDEHAKIAAGTVIYPHVYVGQYAEIGEKSVLYASVTVRERCRIGKRCVLHANSVVGSDGFGFTTSGGVHTKVPQVGNVVLEDDVEIGSHVGIDRATTGSTVIGRGTKIDNLVHIGHNCKIGEGNLIVAQTGISGSTTTGANVTFGGQVGTVGHIHIGGNSVYAARSGIIGDMPEGVFCAGFPVQSHQEWLRMQAAMKRLPDLVKKVKQLEKALKERDAKA